MKALTIGTFDVLHWGHLDFLEKCREVCGYDSLLVGVNTDEFVTKFKDKPVMNQDERFYALERHGFRVVFNNSSGRKLIEKAKPEMLIVGSDWARKDYLKQIDVTQDQLDKKGIILVYIPYIQTRPISTSEIKRRILDA